MRSILEKAFIALLNQEKDQADALFHEFILERSRQIHESLRQGEDFILDESWENELSVDEMFTEADLADDEEETADADAGEGEAGDDTEGEAADTDADAGDDTDAEENDNPFGGAGEGEAEEELPIEDRVADIEAELQRLTAEFDTLIGAEEEGLDDVDGLGGDDLVGGDAGEFDDELNVDDDELTVEGDLEITQSADGGDLNVHHDTDGGIGDDDFESLGESVLSDLEKVAIPANTEGRFQGTGKAQMNTKSPTLSKPVEQRQAGEPVKIKSSQHKGYEREASPKTETGKQRQNTMKKHDDNQSSVSKEGDKSALINTGKEDKSNQHSLFDKKYK